MIHPRERCHDLGGHRRDIVAVEGTPGSGHAHPRPFLTEPIIYPKPRCGVRCRRPPAASARDVRSRRVPDAPVLRYAGSMPLRRLFPTLVYGAAARASGRRRAQPPPAARMPAVASRRRRRPRLVAQQLSRAATPRTIRTRRLQRISPTFAQLERASDRHVQRYAARARLQPARPAAGDDRLLGQHHAPARRARPAPAPAVDDQRHLLRAACRAAAPA